MLCSVTSWLFVTPQTVACQSPLPMEFFMQEHWSGILFPTPYYLLSKDCLSTFLKVTNTHTHIHTHRTLETKHEKIQLNNIPKILIDISLKIANNHMKRCSTSYVISSVQFSRSVVSNSLQLHESQHTRPPCPSLTPGVYSNPCPSSWWCHLAISSSTVPFSCCPQSLPASGSFPMSQLFTWDGQSIGSFSFSISPSNEHPGLIFFMMDWLDLLPVQGTLKSLLQYHSSKASIFQHSAFFTVQLSHPYMTNGKTTALTRQTFVGKVMSLLFNMLSWS